MKLYLGGWVAFLHFHIEPMFLSASPGACKSENKKKTNPHTQQVGGVAWHFPGPGPEGEHAGLCAVSNLQIQPFVEEPYSTWESQLCSEQLF